MELVENEGLVHAREHGGRGVLDPFRPVANNDDFPAVEDASVHPLAAQADRVVRQASAAADIGTVGCRCSRESHTDCRATPCGARSGQPFTAAFKGRRQSDNTDRHRSTERLR